MRVARLSDTMVPFTKLMSIDGSADVRMSIFVMEPSYRNVSCPGKPVTAVANSEGTWSSVIDDPTPKSVKFLARALKSRLPHQWRGAGSVRQAWQAPDPRETLRPQLR